MRVVSLFSGCGGLDLGFIKAGYEIVFANDIEKSVERTYKENLGEIVISDIADIDKQLLPDCEVITAGIPCQPFSSAGNRGAMRDDRGNLFLQVMRAVKAKRPKVVLLENVRGFLTSKDDGGVLMTERIRKELSKYNYNLYFKLLNASDYGVPQNRYRVIMVGIRGDVDRGWTFPGPLTDKSKLTVRGVIERQLPVNEVQEVWKLSRESIHLTKFITEGGSWKQVPYDELPERMKKIRDNKKKYRSPTFYRKFGRDEIMGTVTSAATPSRSGILHPLEDRRYSVREIARFQSFPDTFKFMGESIPKKYKMIGNAVPPRLAYHVAMAIKKQVLL